MRIHCCMRRGLAVAVLLTTVGCAGGDDNQTSGFSGFASNPSAPTMPATTPGTGTSEGTSEDSSGSESSTSPVDPTTGVDPTASTSSPMTTMTTDPPMTTSTTMPMTTDPPMTTDESTTSTDTTNGSSSSSSSSSTTMMMTTDPPPPPPKDPQPAQGLYSNCFPSEMCVGLNGGGCLSLQDADMVKFDGFCTILCDSAADCVPKPNSPAVTQCLFIDDAHTQSACFLQCVGDADCPTGMTCELVALPDGDGSYCW